MATDHDLRSRRRRPKSAAAPSKAAWPKEEEKEDATPVQLWDGDPSHQIFFSVLPVSPAAGLPGAALPSCRPKSPVRVGAASFSAEAPVSCDPDRATLEAQLAELEKVVQHLQQENDALRMQVVDKSEIEDLEVLADVQERNIEVIETLVRHKSEMEQKVKRQARKIQLLQKALRKATITSAGKERKEQQPDPSLLAEGGHREKQETSVLPDGLTYHHQSATQDPRASRDGLQIFITDKDDMKEAGALKPKPGAETPQLRVTKRAIGPPEGLLARSREAALRRDEMMMERQLELEMELQRKARFKAKPVPQQEKDWRTIQKEEEEIRKARRAARAAEVAAMSRLPPRMAQHEAEHDVASRRPSTAPASSSPAPPRQSSLSPEEICASLRMRQRRWEQLLAQKRAAVKKKATRPAVLPFEERQAKAAAKAAERARRMREREEEEARTRATEDEKRRQHIIKSQKVSFKETRHSRMLAERVRKRQEEDRKRAEAEAREEARRRDLSRQAGAAIRAVLKERELTDPNSLAESVRRKQEAKRKEFEERKRENEERLRETVRHRPNLIERQEAIARQQAADRAAAEDKRTQRERLRAQQQSDWKAKAARDSAFTEDEREALGLPLPTSPDEHEREQEEAEPQITSVEKDNTISEISSQNSRVLENISDMQDSTAGDDSPLPSPLPGPDHDAAEYPFETDDVDSQPAENPCGKGEIALAASTQAEDDIVPVQCPKSGG